MILLFFEVLYVRIEARVREKLCRKFVPYKPNFLGASVSVHEPSCKFILTKTSKRFAPYVTKSVLHKCISIVRTYRRYFKHKTLVETNVLFHMGRAFRSICEFP